MHIVIAASPPVTGICSWNLHFELQIARKCSAFHGVNICLTTQRVRRTVRRSALVTNVAAAHFVFADQVV